MACSLLLLRQVVGLGWYKCADILLTWITALWKMSKSWESCMRKASQNSSMSGYCGWMSFSVLGLVREELAACIVLSQGVSSLPYCLNIQLIYWVEICSQHVRSPLPHSPRHLIYFLNLLFSKKSYYSDKSQSQYHFFIDFINFSCCLWWQSKPWPFMFSLWFWNNLNNLWNTLTYY